LEEIEGWEQLNTGTLRLLCGIQAERQAKVPCAKDLRVRFTALEHPVKHWAIVAKNTAQSFIEEVVGQLIHDGVRDEVVSATFQGISQVVTAARAHSFQDFLIGSANDYVTVRTETHERRLEWNCVEEFQAESMSRSWDESRRGDGCCIYQLCHELHNVVQQVCPDLDSHEACPPFCHGEL
jgi:hypothetical protein